MAGIIKGFKKIVKQAVRESDSQAEAVRRATEVIPNSQLVGNKGSLRDAIKEEINKQGPKSEARKTQTSKLERSSTEAQRRSKDGPQTAALVQQRDALAAKPKRDGDPTKTKEEAGSSAARIALGMTSRQRTALQNSYNGKKAQIAWLEENNPGSSRISDLRKELRKLDNRAFIDTDMPVKPKRPPGEKSAADTAASAKKTESNKNSRENRMQMIRDAQKKLRNEGVETNLTRIDDTKNMSRGGKVTKSRMGKQDFRYNKGGLLLSSVDNRKKK